MSQLFAPLPEREFDAYHAAHLYWRAGFGCQWSQAEALAAKGLNSAIDYMLAWPEVPVDAPVPETAALPKVSRKEFEDSLQSLSEDEKNKLRNERGAEERKKIEGLKLWWLEKMSTAEQPLLEKLTLFWHSHFASSYYEKIEETFPMWQQNQLFRRLALAPLPELMEAVSKDGAMLIWLDNWRNNKGAPNENYARELMELFSMGPGPYSEKDVQESARAFTGWSTNKDDYQFEFHRGRHDGEEKTFFGKTGDWDGSDIVRMICEHPATPRFMARKFLHFFVCNNPPEEMVEEAAGIYKAGGMSAKPLLGAIFRSGLFYSDFARQKVVKSPVSLSLGALKSMNVQGLDRTKLLDALRLMGEDLFFPPDVNGWPGGMTWISSNTLLLRYNFSNFLLNGVSADDFKTFEKTEGMTASDRREFIEAQRGNGLIEWSPRKQLEERGLAKRLTSANMLVDYFSREFLQRPLDRATLDNYLRFCQTDASGGRADYSIASPNFDERTKGLVHLIMSSPEYQLC